MRHKPMFTSLSGVLHRHFHGDVLFVHSYNPHSRQAHQQGHDMTERVAFDFNRSNCHVFALRCDDPVTKGAVDPRPILASEAGVTGW